VTITVKILIVVVFFNTRNCSRGYMAVLCEGLPARLRYLWAQ